VGGGECDGACAIGLESLRARKARVLAALERHPFRPPLWCRNPHLQTAWGPLLRPRPRLEWRREVLTTPDDDRLRLYRVAGAEEGPVVLLLHGLEGSAASNYVGGLAQRLARAGFAPVAMEFRSCGGELNRARRLYHSGETTDLAFVVGELVRRSTPCDVYLVGFSLGGNVVAKWLGELGDDAPEQVRGAAVVSPPFDLTVSGPALDAALFGVYARRFLRTLVPKALAKERQYPGCLDAPAVRTSRDFTAFDTHATAALHGFRDAHDYWEKVGCGQFLAGIRRPALLLAAHDDPFNPGSTLPQRVASTSPWLVPCFPRRGGHVGFVYGPPWRTRHWAEEQIERFLLLVQDRDGGER
jgi:hypothetical protein